MKKLILFLSLFFSIYISLEAQSIATNTFNGRVSIQTVSNVVDSTWAITGYFSNSVQKYTASQILVNDRFYVQIGANTYRGRVSVVNSPTGNLISIRIVCNLPNAPSGVAAILRETSNGYPVFVDGIANSLQAGIQNYFANIINSATVPSPCEQTVTQAAHGFRDFTPVRWNSNTSTYERPTKDTLVPDYIVVDSLTANTFKVANCGTYTTSLTNGLYWFTSASPGYSLTADTTKVPLFQALNGKLILNPIVGFNLMSGSGDVTSAVLADTAAAIRADFPSGSGITALTGDVTASGTGSVVATVANDAITSAKVASQTLDSTDLKNRGITLLKISPTGATNGYIPKYNSTTGNVEWADDAGGSTTPGGSTTQVQYNNAGAFAGDSKMAFNSTTKTLTVSKVEVTDTTDSGTPAAAVRINRSLTSAISANGHGFRDQTMFTRPIYSYASFDGALTANNTGNNDHFVTFQSRISAATSGTISTMWAGVDNNSIDGSRVTNLTSWESAPAYTSGIGADFRRGFRVKDMTGATTTGTQYGMYIDSLGNASSNYGIYIAATKTGGYAVYSPGRVAANYYAGKTSMGSVFNTAAMGASLTVDNVLNNTIPALVVSVDPSANQRKSIIFRQDTRSNLSFSDFSGNFQPSLQLQSDDNTKMLWIAPSGGTGGNAMMYAGATGFEIVTGSSVISGGTSRFQITNAGRASFGVSTPTAVLHLKAGTATANTAPLKLTSGTSLTTAEAGAIEYDGTEFYGTTSTASRTIFARVLKGSGTLDFPDTASGSTSSLTITVTGAATTDSGVSVQRDNASISGTSYEWVITGANTVTVYFHNFSGSNQNPASGTFRATVTK